MTDLLFLSGHIAATAVQRRQMRSPAHALGRASLTHNQRGVKSDEEVPLDASQDAALLCLFAMAIATMSGDLECPSREHAS
jgi:hypothetical protein